MQFGRDNVNAEPIRCPQCRSEVFWLFDAGTGTTPGTVKTRLQCVGCKGAIDKVLMPAMTENAGQAEAVQPLPGQKLPENVLICGRGGMARTKSAPDGVCRGVQFRVLNRGNEYYSRCLVCGNGEPMGIEYHSGQVG